MRMRKMKEMKLEVKWRANWTQAAISEAEAHFWWHHEGRNNHINDTVWPNKCLNKNKSQNTKTVLYWLLSQLFTDIFQLLVGRANLYYQKHLSKQAAPRSLPDITLPDKITVLYLVVQMRHVLQDKLQDRWSRLNNFTLNFVITQRHRFLYTGIFFHLGTNTKDLNKKTRTALPVPVKVTNWRDNVSTMYDKRRYAACVSYGSRRQLRHTRYELVPLWRHVLLWCTPIRTKL